MQRYFVEKCNNNKFCLNKEDSYHLVKVMRANINEMIEIVYNEKLYLAKTKVLDINKVVLEKVKELPVVDLKYNVTIAQSLVVEQKFSTILQKSTELGVSTIIPLLVSRSKINLDKKELKKIERWQKIVKEASSQSKRIIVPKVRNVYSIKELIKEEFDYKFLCSVNEHAKSIKIGLQNISSCDKILFVVGPEGGFTDEEENLLINNGFVRISLGELVLRTETASIAILSMVNYHFMR